MKKTALQTERYTNGKDVIFYAAYMRPDGKGLDEVLQHKVAGTSETAHITLHPDGEVNFRITRSKKYLENAVNNMLQGYHPTASRRVREFIKKVIEKF